MYTTTCGSYISSDGREIWVVFGGRRHHVVSEDVYNALFEPYAQHKHIDDLMLIPRGFDFGHGTCLIKCDNTEIIYILARGSDSQVRKHRICDFETFKKLSLNLELCRVVPGLVIDAIVSGEDIYCGTSGIENSSKSA